MMADDLKNVLMVSPDGEMAQVSPDMVEAARSKGARVISHNSRLLAKYADTIPSITGFAGALAGGILAGGSTAGAAALTGMAVGGLAGGSIGEVLRVGARSALGYPTPPPAEVAGGVAREAGLQGMFGLLGGIPAGGSRVVGREFLKSAHRPETQMQLETIERSRVPVGPGAFPASKTGVGQINAALEAPGEKLLTYLDKADNATMLGQRFTISRREVLSGLQSLYNETKRMATSSEKANVIKNVLDELKAGPERMKPSEVQKLKSDMQELLAAQYQKSQGGSPVSLTPLDAALNQARDAVAKGARGALESIGGGKKGSLGWHIKQANTEMAPLLDLKPSVAWEEAGPIQAARPGTAVEPVIQTLRGRTPSPLRLGLGRGVDVPLMMAGNNPQLASRIGLGLTHPGTLASLRATPQVAYAISRLLQEPAVRDATTQGGSR